MSNKKDNIKKEYIMKIVFICLIIVIILTIISILNLLKASQTIKKESIENVEVVLTEDRIKDISNKSEIEKIKKMQERTRIEYYVTKFINYAENEEYEKAYDLLNEDYRKNYFPTESSFRDYAKETFTKMLNVEYTNIERNGDIYVSWVTITDALNGTRDSGKEFNFVIKENDFNDFELSFSKK